MDTTPAQAYALYTASPYSGGHDRRGARVAATAVVDSGTPRPMPWPSPRCRPGDWRKRRASVVLLAWAGVGASAAGAGAAPPMVHRPASLECSDRPVWERFRQLAGSHAARNWPAPEEVGSVEEAAELRELEATSRRLVDEWWWMVCAGECRSLSDLQWGFVEEWGARCASSGQFDRYLVTHYFRNRGLNFTGRAPSGFCHYGFITALVIRAQFEFRDSVSRAQRFLLLADGLLGDYFAFDWLESSGWPVTSLMVTLNLRVQSQRILAGKQIDAMKERHPGELGAASLRHHTRWQGTSEAAKSSWIGGGALEARPQLTIWQFDQHTALAGEAKTMLVRFSEAIGVDTRFLGNSLADSTCGNYDLCPDEATGALLNELLARYYKAKEPFQAVVGAFSEAVAPLVANADVVMCSQPLSWCRFLLPLGKPMLLYAGLPVMWAVRDEDRAEWAEDFARLLASQRCMVIAESVFMAREIHWQFGLRVPAMRLLGLHTNASYAPLQSDRVLVSRFGTSGALSECVFDLFVEANRDWFHLRFVQMEALIFDDHLRRMRTDSFNEATTWKQHTEEIKVPVFPYRKLAQHLASICMPYDTSIFLFNEIYSMNIPVFVPRDLWRWLIGLHTLPSMDYRVDWQVATMSRLHGPGPQHEVPLESPFYASVYEPMDPERAVDWAAYSDWALLPHVRYFSNVPDLFVQLLDAESLHDTSARMKSTNDEELVIAVGNWRRLAFRLLYASRA